jgi:hypothetical protein
LVYQAQHFYGNKIHHTLSQQYHTEAIYRGLGIGGRSMDNVNHPSHYTEGKIECIEYIEDKLTPEEYRGYIKGNVLKYITREKHKNGDEDIRKAKWYLDRLVNRLGENK